VIWLEVGTDRKPADGDAVGAINKGAWSQFPKEEELGRGTAVVRCSWAMGVEMRALLGEEATILARSG
jgi:hypothetical protein